MTCAKVGQRKGLLGSMIDLFLQNLRFLHILSHPLPHPHPTNYSVVFCRYVTSICVSTVAEIAVLFPNCFMFKCLKSPLENAKWRKHSGGHECMAPCSDRKWLSVTKHSEMLGLLVSLSRMLYVQTPRGSIPRASYRSKLLMNEAWLAKPCTRRAREMEPL